MDASKRATAKKTAAVAKKAASHPAYKEMIVEALRTLKERSGSSRQKIYQFIQQNYKVGGDEAAIKRHLKVALKRGVQSGAIIQSKGVGASGSFKLPAAAKKPAPKKPVVKKTVKPAAKKPAEKKASAAKKSPAKKKPASAKKSASKSPKKPKAKEVKKPVAKKSPAKKAKKAIKPKAKSPAAKKSSAKGKGKK